MAPAERPAVRLAGWVHVEHPGHSERSYAFLSVDRGLKSGRLDEICLDVDDLLALAESAVKAALILRRGVTRAR